MNGAELSAQLDERGWARTGPLLDDDEITDVVDRFDDGEELYPPLAGVADAWARRSGQGNRWPPDLAGLLARCPRHGQTRPTPLVLRYGPGGYNTLHQDRYGDVAFPLQVVVGLSEPGVDYTGGEFLLTEQRPRAQTPPRRQRGPIRCALALGIIFHDA